MIFTKHCGHASDIAAECVGYSRIICVGGDGTLSEVCNGLLKSEKSLPLGYVPTGSTNDFARGLGLPKSIKKSVLLAASDDCFPLDAGLFTNDSGEERYFSYVASFGVFTKISYTTAQRFKNRLGHLAYVFEGLKSLSDLQSFKPFKLNIDADGEALDGEYIFGAITNSTSLGGLVRLDKNSVTVNDGLFELLLIRKPGSIIELTDTVGRLLNRKYNQSSIIFRHIKKLTLKSSEPLEWTLDGEYAGKTLDAKINVKESALNFIRKEKVRKIPLLPKKTL